MAILRIIDTCDRQSALRFVSGVAAASVYHAQAVHVVVKPNWIQETTETEQDPEAILTAPVVLLSVLTGVLEALPTRGVVTVCDAPHTYADFEGILRYGECRALLSMAAEARPDVRVEIIDLRREVWRMRDRVVVARRPNPPDPRGYVAVDLASDSMLHGHAGRGRYYGADYDRNEVNAHHSGGRHEYLLSGSAIKADLFINVPKLKTHKKTGLTCAIKNLVGVNGDKNWLPHHTEGTPASGGDERPRATASGLVEATLKPLVQSAVGRSPAIAGSVYRLLRRSADALLADSARTIRNGNWEGNDTCWRMAVDLNRALLYADASGRLDPSRRKPYLCIVDGMLGGEGNGPLESTAVESNVIVVGEWPADVDAVAARLMGFPIDRLPIVSRAFDPHRYPIASGPLDAVVCHDDRTGVQVAVDAIAPALGRPFRPHYGWPSLVEQPTA